MPFCSTCGSEHAAGVRFCSNCGAALTGAATRADVAPERDYPEYEYVEPRIRTKIPDFVLDQLRDDEEVLCAFSASLLDHRRSGEFRHDKFVLTTSRVIYFHTSLFHKGMGEMPYRGITGVSYNKGFRHGKVVVEAANAGITIDGIGNDDAGFAEYIISGILAGRRYTTYIDEADVVEGGT
jgi:hypothetical protein